MLRRRLSALKSLSAGCEADLPGQIESTSGLIWHQELVVGGLKIFTLKVLMIDAVFQNMLDNHPHGPGRGDYGAFFMPAPGQGRTIGIRRGLQQLGALIHPGWRCLAMCCCSGHPPAT